MGESWGASGRVRKVEGMKLDMMLVLLSLSSEKSEVELRQPRPHLSLAAHLRSVPRLGSAQAREHSDCLDRATLDTFLPLADRPLPPPTSSPRLSLTLANLATMSGKGLSKEDTKTEHPFQAIVLCDSWGEEQRWGPLVRRARTEDEEFDEVDVGGEQRPFVRTCCPSTQSLQLP